MSLDPLFRVKEDHRNGLFPEKMFSIIEKRFPLQNLQQKRCPYRSGFYFQRKYFIKNHKIMIHKCELEL